MKSIFTIIFSLIYTLSFSQRLQENDGQYFSRVEYSVSNKNNSEIYNKCRTFLNSEISDRQILDDNIEEKIKKFSGVAKKDKISFDFEVICFNDRFLVRLTNFKYKDLPIEKKEKFIPEINQYLLELFGRWQYFVRYP
jgi:hypothetical protein